MADEYEASLSDIMSNTAPAPEPTVETPTTTTEQTAAPATEGAVRDEHGRFASKAPTDPAAPVQQPEVAPTPEASGMVPQQALHETRQQLKEERERREAIERRLLAIETARQPAAPPAAPVEPPKPLDFWEDPDKWGESKFAEKLTPVQEEIAQTRAFYSNRDAIREHGADVVKAAQTALGEAIQTGRMEDAKVAAHLKRSMDPVGEIVAWHKQVTNQQRIGSDPDAFVQSEIEKMLGDPAKKAELLARLTGSSTPAPADPAASPSPAATVTNVTRLPPSLSRLPGGNAAPVDGDDSLESIIQTRPGRSSAR